MTQKIDESLPGERQDSDYDGAWKEALKHHLRQFIDLCFPKLAELIDWTFAPEWLDKEISQIVGQAGRRNREVDLLVRVRLVDGNEQWVLCHLEIQTSYESDFAFRVDLYNAGLKWLFRKDVLTLVILADLNPDWKPTEHRFVLGGFESYRRFPICKVLTRLETDWLNEVSLPVQVARAQIAALRTASDPDARFDAKTQLVRNLYTAGYNAGEVREIFRLIDWMLHLRLDLSRKFELELIAYEKEIQMPYVTSIERHAKEDGLRQGIEKGREEASGMLLLSQLTELCGQLSEEDRQQVGQLTLQQRQVLSVALLKFHSLTDLRTWLSTNSDSQELK